MASTYDSMFQTGAFPAHEDVFGEPVTFAPSGGVATAVTGLWEPSEEQDEFPEDGKQAVQRGRLTLAPDALTAWTPDLRDKATIGGVTYAVEEILQTLPIVELSMIRRVRRRVGGSNTFKER